MSEFVPHKIDAKESFESSLLGAVKAGFPSPAEDDTDSIGTPLVKVTVVANVWRAMWKVRRLSIPQIAAIYLSKM